MDHYYMVIATLASSETENAEVLSVIQDIRKHMKGMGLTTGNNINHLSNFKPNLHPRPRYWSSFIYTQSSTILSPGYAPAVWNLCCETSDFSEEIAYKRTPLKSKTSNDQQQIYLGDIIHQLCDELPSIGTCVLDVIWVTLKAEGLPCLKEKFEVFGALSRMVHWYRAKLSICCCQNDTTSCNPSNFTGLLPFQTLWRPFLWNEILFENVVWRGGIHLQNQILEGFQLGYAGSSHPSIIVSDCDKSISNIFQKISNDPQASEQFCLNGPLTILGKYPLSVIPPHMVAARKLELSVPDSPLLENSSEFLAAANSDSEMCFLMQLVIRETSNNTDSNPMNTKTWKERVVAGNYKVCKDLFSKEIDHRLLLLIGDGSSSKHSASVYVMRDVNDYDPKTCLQVGIANAKYPSYQEVNLNNCPNESFLKNLPAFSSHDVKQLGETLLEKQIWGLQLLIEKMGSEIPAAYVRTIIKDTGSRVISEFKPANVRKLKNVTIEGDPGGNENSHQFRKSLELDEHANWPEKIYLKMLNKRRNLNEDLERPNSEVTFLKIGELAERLQSLEKCRDNFWDYTKNEPNYPAPPLHRLTWPEAKYCNFHDVFYCKDQSSYIKQQKMNYIEARCIAYDTASSHENIPEGQVRELTPRLQSLIQVQEDKVAVKMPHRKSARLRSSALQMKQNTNNRPKSKQENNTRGSSEGLSEKNLQKLRIAVVDALELYNIRLEHPLFKTCAKKLFTICKTFAKDVIGSGSASKRFMAIAESHVQQVIHFETNRPAPRSSKRIGKQ